MKQVTRLAVEDPKPESEGTASHMSVLLVVLKGTGSEKGLGKGWEKIEQRLGRVVSCLY